MFRLPLKEKPIVLTAVWYINKARIIKIFYRKANSKNLPLLKVLKSSVHKIIRKAVGFFHSKDTEHENSEAAEAEGSSVNRYKDLAATTHVTLTLSQDLPEHTQQLDTFY